MSSQQLTTNMLITHAENYHKNTEIISYNVRGEEKISNWSAFGKRSKKIAYSLLQNDYKEGDILGLLGRNGAGKSTLLKSIMGLVEIVSGKISLDEEVLSDKKAEEIPYFGIGYVPQGRRLFPELMVEEK